MLCWYAGLNQREAATHLGLTTGAAVSAQLKRLEQVLAANQPLAKRWAHIDGVLGGLKQKAQRLV